jgi:ubiquinone/menaquinone biosynthesis C-methylase UbiE
MSKHAIRTYLGAALGLLGAVAPAAVEAQLGGRPAEEWAVVLESGRRLQGLDIENVVKAMELRPGDIVADIGAGTGIFAIPIAEAVGPNGAVLAVEVDAGFLPMIVEKASQAKLPNVTPVLGEFEDPKLPRRDVTVAFFHDVLHHIQDRRGYLRALNGYMAPGGRIVVVDYHAAHPATPHQNEPEMLITLEQVNGWMREAGYALTSQADLFEEKFVVVYTRQ